jgi:hypothetical protein
MIPLTPTIRTPPSRADPRNKRSTIRRKPNGLVLYRGPSLLNGQPVVCIATGLVNKSKNRTTGPFVQTYLLPDSGESPLVALSSGDDAAVCGDCPHRPVVLPDGRRTLGSCYDNVGHGPLAVWQAYRRGAYPPFRLRQHLDCFRGRLIRLGSYGDPAAVPLTVWATVCEVSAGWTGYTHQFRTCDPGYARYCMASCETVADRHLALRLGYRTFRVRLPEQPLDAGEFVCPASEEGGGAADLCGVPGLCGGRGRPGRQPVRRRPRVPLRPLQGAALPRLPRQAPARAQAANLPAVEAHLPACCPTLRCHA